MGMLLAGCGREYFVTVADTRGVVEGAPVIWLDAPGGPDILGKVSKIKAQGGQFSICFAVENEELGTFRQDVMACPAMDEKTLRLPCLYVLGGNNASLPVLQGGRIQEMPLEAFMGLRDPEKSPNFLKWFASEKQGWIPVAAALVLVWIAWKIIKKFIKTVLVILLVLALLYGKHVADEWARCKARFSEYVDSITLDDIHSRMEKHIEPLLKKIPETLRKGL